MNIPWTTTEQCQTSIKIKLKFIALDIDFIKISNNIVQYHVSVGNRGLSDVGAIFYVKFLSQEFCVRCRDMLEVGVSDVEV